MSRTLVSYILREVILYSALGGLAVTGVFFGGNVPRHLGDLIAVGFSLGDVLALVRALVGIVATYIAPIAFLFGVLLTLARMAADREVLAMRVCGIGTASILLPVAALGLLISLATGYLANEVEHRARQRMRAVAQSLATRGATLQPGQFLRLGERVIYARDRQLDDLLEGVMIADRSDARRPLLIFAEYGRFGFDEARREFRFRLESGEVHVEPGDGPAGALTGYQRVSFLALDYAFDAEPLFQVAFGAFRPYDMSNDTLREVLARAAAGRSLAQYAKKEPVHYRLELYQRRALPAAPFLFALVGVPLALRVRRGARSWGAVLCALLALGYYLVLSVGRELAAGGVVPAALAMWAPNAVFALLAAALWRRRDRV